MLLKKYFKQQDSVLEKKNIKSKNSESADDI